MLFSLFNDLFKVLLDFYVFFFITSYYYFLIDVGEALARKLIDANVDTACVRINNTIHDFMLLNALKESKATKAGYKILCRFLGHALNNN